MKYSLCISLLFLLVIDLCLTNNFEFEFLNRLRMSTHFKMKSRTFLQKLFTTSNTFKGKPLSKGPKPLGHPHSSKSPKKKVNYFQYEYYEYNDIAESLKDMAEKYPDLVKLETAQKRFNLPHPGGDCSHKGDKCEHFIVTLTNHKKDNKNKPQVR